MLAFSQTLVRSQAPKTELNHNVNDSFLVAGRVQWYLLRMQERHVAPGSEGACGWSFGNTDWWVVRCAGRENPEAEIARTRLCQSYWRPVFRYVRKLGYSFEDAEDLTQGFFARLLEKNALVAADREKGKFRSFLLTLLKRFLADQRDWEHSQKRGGSAGMVSLDSGDTKFRQRLEPIEQMNPSKICERKWVALLLDRALEELACECATNGKDRIFDALKPLVMAEGEMSYAVTARKLELTEANVKVMVHRLRGRLRELLVAEIEASGTPVDQVGAELRELYTILSA